jgi:hypothetical protein
MFLGVRVDDTGEPTRPTAAVSFESTQARLSGNSPLKPAFRRASAFRSRSIRPHGENARREYPDYSEHPLHEQRDDLDQAFGVLSVEGRTVQTFTFASALADADEYEQWADDGVVPEDGRALVATIRAAVAARDVETLRELANDGELRPQDVDGAPDFDVFVDASWPDRLSATRCPRMPTMVRGASRIMRARPRERRSRRIRRAGNRAGPSREDDPDPDDVAGAAA